MLSYCMPHIVTCISHEHSEKIINIKIYFYKIKKPNFKLLIPEIERIENINQDCIIDLGFNKLGMKKVLLQGDEEIIDITQIINEIKKYSLTKKYWRAED